MARPTKATTHKLGNLVQNVTMIEAALAQLMDAKKWTSARQLRDSALNAADAARQIGGEYGTSLTVTAKNHLDTLRSVEASVHYQAGKLGMVTSLYREITGARFDEYPPDDWSIIDALAAPAPAAAPEGTETFWQWAHSGYESDLTSEHNARYWAGRHNRRGRGNDDPARLRKVIAEPWRPVDTTN